MNNRTDWAFQNQRVIEVPFPKMQQLILTCIMGFLKFLSEPLEVKESWTYNSGRRGKKPDEGYRGVFREEGTTKDSKEIMHIRPASIPVWEQQAMKYVYYADHVRNWLTLRRAAIETMYKFAPSKLLSLLQECDEIHVLRMVRYHNAGAPASNIIATDHFDESCLTVQIAQNRPAFRSRRGAQYEIHYPKQGHVLLFTGLKAQLATGGTVEEMPGGLYRVVGGLYHALLHGAYDQNHNATDPRWAIILFGHTKDQIPYHLDQAV